MICINLKSKNKLEFGNCLAGPYNSTRHIRSFKSTDFYGGNTIIFKELRASSGPILDMDLRLNTNLFILKKIVYNQMLTSVLKFNPWPNESGVLH